MKVWDKPKLSNLALEKTEAKQLCKKCGALLHVGGNNNGETVDPGTGHHPHCSGIMPDETSDVF